MNIHLEELMNQARSSDNQISLHAVDKLRARGWLTDGSLEGTGLCKSHLQGANLAAANFSCASLHQANLEWANLSGAVLQATKLSLCNLAGANMQNAKIERADFYKANLRGVQNLTDEQLLLAERLWSATMPNGERYDGCFSLSGDLALARWKNVDTSDPQALAEFYGVPMDVYTQGQLRKTPGEQGNHIGLPQSCVTEGNYVEGAAQTYVF